MASLYLTEFNFSGSTPSRQTLPNNGIVYQWVTGSDAATSPVLPWIRVNPARRDPDPHANNVYIAWASIDTLPAAAPTTFNPNRAELVVGTPISSVANPSANAESLAFSGVTTVNAGGNSGGVANDGNDDSHPQLVINQNDDGQVTVAWDDFGTDAAVPADLLMSNLVQAGDTYGFTGATGPIQPGILPSGSTTAIPVSTPFTDSVTVPDPSCNQRPHRHG